MILWRKSLKSPSFSRVPYQWCPKKQFYPIKQTVCNIYLNLPNSFSLGEQNQLRVYLEPDGGFYFYQGKYRKLDGKDYVENNQILSISLYNNKAQILVTQCKPSYV